MIKGPIRGNSDKGRTEWQPRQTVGRRALQSGEGTGSYGSYGSYWRGLGVVIALWAAVVPASARSTLSARLDQPAIAGPALDQQSILYLHYFPGDGEAIVSADLQCLGNAQLQSVRSALGKAQLEAASIAIDYAARPLAGEHIDTLYIDLVAAELGTIDWSAAIHSSLDSQGTPAHQIEFDLAVRPPPAISWSIEPPRVYQGERFDLRAIVRLDDATGPPLEELNWTWPPELSWPAGDAPQRWAGSLSPGQADTLSWTVLVDPTHLGPLPLAVAAQVSGQSPVDLATQHLQVDPLPVMALENRVYGSGQARASHLYMAQRKRRPHRLGGPAPASCAGVLGCLFGGRSTRRSTRTKKRRRSRTEPDGEQFG